MSTRVDEKYIVAEIWDTLGDNIAGVVFYIPEKLPKVDTSNKWVMIEINLMDQETRSGEWSGEGRFTAYVNTRQDLNDYHSARELADQIINQLELNASSMYVTSNGSSQVGVIRFGPFASQPMGLMGGIIEHTITAPFQVYSIS